MLFDILDAVLGTTTKVRLLRVLLRLEFPVSAREAQRLAGVRSSDALKGALAELEGLGLLHRQKVGRAHGYTANRNHDLYRPLLALFTGEAERVDTLASWILHALERRELDEAVRSVVLFGSNARRQAQAGSDVDLLVVTHAAKQVGRVDEVLWGVAGELETSMGVRLAPYVLPAAQVRERHAAGDPLMQAIEREGRSLLGDSFAEVLAW